MVTTRSHRRKTDARWCLGMLALPLVMLGCSDGSGGGGAVQTTTPTPPPPGTESYLSNWLDPQNVFRWTVPTGVSEIRLYIELDDLSGLGALSRADVEDIVIDVRKQFKSAVRLSGRAIDSDTRVVSRHGRHSTARARIIVSFSENPIPDYPEALGIARPRRLLGTSYLDRVDVTVLTRNPKTGLLLSKEQVLSVTLHEFGHAMGITCGLDGSSCKAHSPNPGDIMYPATQYFFQRLSPGDRFTIRDLYELAPTVLRKDDIRL